MKRLAISLCCLMFLSACSLFFSAPEVTLKDVKIVGLDGGGMMLDVYLSLKNPNSTDITLKGYSYDLKVLDLSLAKGGARETTVFHGHTTTDVVLPVRLPYTDVAELIRHHPDPDHIPYRLSAGLEVETPLGDRTLPVEKSGIFKIPEKYRPSFYLRKLKDLFDSGDKESEPES